MRFSIVIPVCNTRIYLDECLQSVLNQTVVPFEVILTDDGSTDGSVELCDSYARTHPEKIRILRLNRSGPLIARQKALGHASGDVIVFLDSDDCLREDALETLERCFQSQGCDLILYHYSRNPDFSTRDSYYGLAPGALEKRELYRAIVATEIPNGVCLKAAKRECFRDMPDFGGLSHVKNGEDLLMSLYMVTAAESVYFLEESLYYYRLREGSAVRSYNPDRPRSVKTVHQELERFIDRWNMPELHPLHRGREVRGWVDTMRNLMENRPKELHRILREMAEDDYFRRAYASMEPGSLSKEFSLLAKWLYQKKFALLEAAWFLRRLRNVMK